MKKIFLFFCFIILSTIEGYSQANTYWHDRIDTTIYATTTGTNTYTGTNTNTNFNVAKYMKGLLVTTFIVNGNSGPCTYKLVTASGTLSALAIKSQNGAALASGDIPDSSAVSLLYYPPYWRLMGVHKATSAWLLTGNAGTTAGTNFLGTTDSVNMIFKTNGIERMRLTRQGGQLQMLDGGAAGSTVVPVQLALFSTAKKYYSINAANTTTVNTSTGVNGGGVGIYSSATGIGGNTNVGLVAAASGATANYGLALLDALPAVGTNNWSFLDSSAAQSYFRGNVGIGVYRASSLLHVGGAARLGVASTTAGSLIFQNATNTNTCTITAGVFSANIPWTLPTAQGAASTALINNGSGVLSWGSASGMGGWAILGNAGISPTGSNFLGTTDNISLRFRTNNLQRMMLDSTGSLGIRTGAPSAYLQVNGLGTKDMFRLHTNTSGGAFTFLVDSMGTVTIKDISGTILFKANTNTGGVGMGTNFTEGDGVSIGNNATCSGTSKTGIAIGTDASATGTNAFAAGRGAIATDFSSAFGFRAKASNVGQTYGIYVNATANEAVSIGGGDCDNLGTYFTNSNATTVEIVSHSDVASIILSGGSCGTAAITTINNGLGIAATQTTVNASVSGSVVFSEPQIGSSYKLVAVHANAALGTASYTFPVPFTNTPSIMATSTLAAGVVTSLSTTAITITGAGATGFLQIVEY